jgi:hypothetical protein
MNKEELENLAFKRLLKRASQPEPPAGAEERAMMRIRLAAAPRTGNVVELRKPAVRSYGWIAAAAIPLAASLVLGVLIGSDSMLDRLLPESVASLVQPTDLDLGLPSLLGDADALDGDLA